MARRTAFHQLGNETVVEMSWDVARVLVSFTNYWPPSSTQILNVSSCLSPNPEHSKGEVEQDDPDGNESNPVCSETRVGSHATGSCKMEDIQPFEFISFRKPST